MSFEANVGQAGEQVKFLTRAHGYTVFLSDEEAVLALASPDSKQGGARPGQDAASDAEPAPMPPVLKLRWAGAAAHAEGIEELEGKINYLIGNDPTAWKTNIPTFARVRYQNVSPGVDLVFYGNHSNLEYDFVVAPGADPRAVTMEIEGADSMRVDDNGDLVIRAGGAEVRQLQPVVYQKSDGGAAQEVQARYAVDGTGRVRLDIGSYDAGRELVIDPSLIYSTFLGGNGSDVPRGVAADSNGAAYVVGHTTGGFPVTAGAFDTTFNGGTDAFVTKMDPSGAFPIYSTYLGGIGNDYGYDIAVDSAGQAYVTGSTSASFPVTPGAFDTTFNGGTDAFVTKLNPAGSGLVFSTYLGGNLADLGFGIALDTAGWVYVTGSTASANFPVMATAFDTTLGGPTDAFVTKLDPAGAALGYSTFLGGANNDNGAAVAVDSGGHAYVTGTTGGAGFPVTPGAFDTSFNGMKDAFATELDPAGSALLYSTFLGGANVDSGVDIAVGMSASGLGQMYVVGHTLSPGYPVTPGAYDTSFNGRNDAFVTCLVPAVGGGLVYSTFLGGASDDYGRSIAVDASGSAFVAGYTKSRNFPVTPGTIDPTFNGVGDAFVSELDPSGGSLPFSTFLGGTADDAGYGITLSFETLYVVGYTSSHNYPTTPGVFQSLYGGGVRDAFVTRLTWSSSRSQNDQPPRRQGKKSADVSCPWRPGGSLCLVLLPLLLPANVVSPGCSV